MHQHICQTEAYDISWIEGSQCLVVVVREGVQGFRGVSKFFSSLREARSAKAAEGWVLDLRKSHKIPEELWNWVHASWFPQLTDEGLRRQALILPEAAAARSQWRGLEISALSQEEFSSLPRAIMWLGTEFGTAPVRQRSRISAPVRARL
ncbi:MAG: hypothetical protein AB8B96_16040 [Lysobacterales bacterium]